jgi:hypothetical protein
MRFATSLLPALLALSIGVAQAPAPAEQDAKTPTKLGDTGFEMVLPPDMEVVESPPAGVVFMASGGADDGFRDNINLGVGPPQMPEATDEQLRTQMVEVLSKVLSDYEFVTDGRMKVCGRDTYWLHAKFMQGELQVRNLQVLVPGEPCYWLTLTAHGERYTARAAQMREALASLRRIEEVVEPPRIALLVKDRKVAAEELGFAFQLPAGWHVSDQEVAGAFVNATAEPVGGLASNVNVRVAEGSEALDPGVIREGLAKDLSGVLQDFKIVACSVRSVGKRKVVRALATYRLAEQPVTLLQYIVPGKPQSFIASYTVFGKDAAKVISACDASAATIVVTAPKPAVPKAADK